MIMLRIAPLPSLHARMPQDRRTEALGYLRATLNGNLARRPYTVTVCLYGRWNDKRGLPLERNTDNVVKSVLDLLAEAGGLGKRGRGDQFLDRNLTVQAFHTDGDDYAIVTLV